MLRPGGILGQHLANARARGLFRYLRLEEFTHRNTDGPLNPYSKVYDRRTLERDFPDFEVRRTFQRYLHAPPLRLPGGRLRTALEPLVGWHLWAELRPRTGRPSVEAEF